MEQVALDPAFDFTGKAVIVTGGSRGLGRAIALGFAQRGADVVVSSRRAEACAEVVAEIEALGRRALAIPCHVGEWDGLEALIDGTLAAFGRIDVLVNNAGIAPVAESSLATSEALFDKTFAVNAKGPFRLSALARPHLAKVGGSIINVTSIGSLRPDPAYPVYAAAKGAMNILTRGQAMEFGPEVRVNAIMAGPFWTDIAKSWREDYDANAPSAMHRMGRPEEIVTTALYLASPQSSYTTGTIVRLDGGVIL
ncbi:SDR family oxidoreductase [Novosphingobium sp. KCTC 2891]|uniref:SDR family NAD(P)-dependent oxidoreductase n=1 Tax=Novosphingobium sp. KCTC 2891 TaxID=2989730 RepID=UPI002221EF26|nr:SDR family oxidoreductase [Novosphingobium sp. KCTC 2891]MCW1384688.1 SDR family oxidoreductase [Novosphingobium sp. KCTC 2891]